MQELKFKELFGKKDRRSRKSFSKNYRENNVVVGFYSELITLKTFTGHPGLSPLYLNHLKDILYEPSHDMPLKLSICILDEHANLQIEKSIKVLIMAEVRKILHEKLRIKLYLMKKCSHSLLLGVLLLSALIYTDTTWMRTAKNLMLIEVIKVGGWMYFWTGLHTFIFELKNVTAEVKILQKTLELNEHELFHIKTDSKQFNK